MTIQVSEQGGVVTISCGGETVVVVGTVIYPQPGAQPATNAGPIFTGTSEGVSVPATVDDEPFVIRTGAGGGGVGTFVESIVTPIGPVNLTRADLRAAFENPLREIVTSPAVRALTNRVTEHKCQVIISPGTPRSHTAAAITEIVQFPVFHKRW